MADAKKLEGESGEASARSAESMHVHHRWAQAMTLIQIALAAITILTRNKATGVGAIGVGVASVVVGVLAYAHV